MSRQPFPSGGNPLQGVISPTDHTREAASPVEEKPDQSDVRLRVDLAAIDPTAAAVLPSAGDAALSPEAPSLQKPPLDAGWGVFGVVPRVYAAAVPRGRLAATCFNLVSAILGAGIVAIPSAFKLSGIVMALLHLSLVALGTVYSMNLIAKVVVGTGARTYTEAARRLLGVGADHFVAVLLILLCFGGSVSYIISVNSLLYPILGRSGSSEWLKSKSGIRVMTVLVWLLFMVPLTIPKRINSLRYVSGFGVLVIMYFVIIMVIHSAKHGLKDPSIREEVVLVRTGNAALEGLGVFLFAFLCQINGFEIFHEMEHKTVSNFTLYSAVSVLICTVLYVVAGIFGYLDFGSGVTGSILQLYDPMNDPSMAVAYAGLVIKICIGFVLHMIPFRNAIYHFLRMDPITVSYTKHSLVVLFPSTLALLCGLFFPLINTVMGLSGSFCGGILGMVMPALYYMYCGEFNRRSVGLVNFYGTYLLLIGGCTAVAFGTAATVYSTVQNSFA